MIKGVIIGQHLTVVAPHIAGETIAKLTAEFNFSSEWDGLTKVVYMTDGENTYPYLLSGDKISEEQNLNLTAGKWECFIWGFDTAADIAELPQTATPRLTTTVASFCVKRTGIPGNDPVEVEPASLGEQILAVAKNAKTIADDIQRRADSGELNGKDGRDGKDGKDGYTPVKGIDYFDGEKGEKGGKGDPGKDGAPGRDGIDGTSVTITNISESAESGGTSVVTFSDGKTLSIKNGLDGQGGGSDITVDSEISEASENPVQNKVIKAALDNKVSGRGGVFENVQTIEIPLAQPVEHDIGVYFCTGDGVHLAEGETYTVIIDGVETTAVAEMTPIGGVGIGSDFSKILSGVFDVGDWYVLEELSVVVVGGEGETPTLTVVGTDEEYVPLDPRVSTHLLEFDSLEKIDNSSWRGTGLHFAGTNVYIPEDSYHKTRDSADKFWSDYAVKIELEEGAYVLPYCRPGWELHATWQTYNSDDTLIRELSVSLKWEGYAVVVMRERRQVTLMRYDGHYEISGGEAVEAIERVVNNMLPQAEGVGF